MALRMTKRHHGRDSSDSSDQLSVVGPYQDLYCLSLFYVINNDYLVDLGVGDTLSGGW